MKTCEHHYLGPCPTCHASPPPPAEPTTAEMFAEIRAMLAFSYDDDEPAVVYLALLERRMQESPPLAVLVEGFCQEVENAKFSREASTGGGQTVGRLSALEHIQPSAAACLERWARDFREAMKK